MKALRSLLIASLLAVATTASAQGSPFKFEFHGFVTGSTYMEDQVFVTGIGQGLMLGAPSPANHLPIQVAPPGTVTTKSGTFLGGDIRQSRWIFAMSGPQVMGGATPKAYFEGDFFGMTAPGGLGYESAIPRIRQAFAELNWGNTQFQVGQYSAQLLLAQIPASIAHIANPPTFGAGTLGWRPIGLRLIHAIPMDGFKIELAAELAQSKWNDVGQSLGAQLGGDNGGAPAPINNTPGAVPMGWASGMPQVDARVQVIGKSGGFSYQGYVAAYYESVNLKGFGDTNRSGTPAAPGVVLQDGTRKTSVSPFVAELGGKFNFAPVTLAFNAYTGKATGPLAGAMLQWGDIKDVGAWGQLGADLTKEFSLWVLYGFSSPDKKDVQNWVNLAGANLTEFNSGLRGDNSVIGAMAKYQEGGYALSLEYYGYSTKYLTGNLAPGNSIGTKSESAYQVLLTGGYFF